MNGRHLLQRLRGDSVHRLADHRFTPFIHQRTQAPAKDLRIPREESGEVRSHHLRLHYHGCPHAHALEAPKREPVFPRGLPIILSALAHP